MAEPYNPNRFIPCEIGEQTFAFRFPFNSLILFEKANGGSVPLQTIESQRALIWAAMQWKKDQRMSLEEVGELLAPIFGADQEAFLAIYEKALEAFGQGFPKPKEGADSKNAQATDPTGKNSNVVPVASASSQASSGD